MKAYSVKCPNCNSPIDANSRFCAQCGSPIVIDDEAQELKYTYQHVDDARIREADVHENIRLKELEIELAKLRANVKQQDAVTWMKLVVLLVYFVLIAAILFLPEFVPALSDSDMAGWLLLLIPLGVFLIYFLFRKQ